VNFPSSQWLRPLQPASNETPRADQMADIRLCTSSLFIVTAAEVRRCLQRARQSAFFFTAHAEECTEQALAYG